MALYGWSAGGRSGAPPGRGLAQHGAALWQTQDAILADEPYLVSWLSTWLERYPLAGHMQGAAPSVATSASQSSRPNLTAERFQEIACCLAAFGFSLLAVLPVQSGCAQFVECTLRRFAVRHYSNEHMATQSTVAWASSSIWQLARVPALSLCPRGREMAVSGLLAKRRSFGNQLGTPGNHCC